MRTAAETAQKGSPPKDLPPQGRSSEALLKEVITWLDDAKAEEIVTIDLAGKSSLGDFMIIASGRTDRHVGGIADQLRQKLKEAGVENLRVEGTETCDWVVADAGDIIFTCSARKSAISTSLRRCGLPNARVRPRTETGHRKARPSIDVARPG